MFASNDRRALNGIQTFGAPTLRAVTINAPRGITNGRDKPRIVVGCVAAVDANERTML